MDESTNIFKARSNYSPILGMHLKSRHFCKYSGNELKTEKICVLRCPVFRWLLYSGYRDPYLCTIVDAEEIKLRNHTWNGCCFLQCSTSSSSLVMKVDMPEWAWKLCMSKLVIRSITRTARVTNVMWSNSVLGHWITFSRLSIIPHETRASPPAS